MQSHGCGGWGHMRRDCPTIKGKGKGMDKDKGKGGKGMMNVGKGTGKGWKGSSKGFKGACFKRGELGHRAFECPAKTMNFSANSVDEIEEVPLGGVWVIAAVDVKNQNNTRMTKIKPNVRVHNRFQGFSAEEEDNSSDEFEHTSPGGGDGDDQVDVCLVVAQKLTRQSAIEFNVADVRKPLASAVKMVRSKNRVVLDEDGSYIQNKLTGECMEVKIQDETFVFDVEFDNGESGTITLDSGAGVNVWPEDKLRGIPTKPKKTNLKMSAANGTEIQNYGQKVIKFCGIDSTAKVLDSSFTWQA